MRPIVRIRSISGSWAGNRGRFPLVRLRSMHQERMTQEHRAGVPSCNDNGAMSASRESAEVTGSLQRDSKTSTSATRNNPNTVQVAAAWIQLMAK